MRHAQWLFPATLALLPVFSSPVLSAVTELDGEELVDAYVQGISIGQVVTDKTFATDDQQQRDILTDTENAAPETAAPIAVANIEALHRTPDLDEMVAGIARIEDRALIEETIAQNILGTRFDLNLDQVAADMQLPATAQDFSVLRGGALELQPSATGYQFEFLPGRQ